MSAPAQTQLSWGRYLAALVAVGLLAVCAPCLAMGVEAPQTIDCEHAPSGQPESPDGDGHPGSLCLHCDPQATPANLGGGAVEAPSAALPARPSAPVLVSPLPGSRAAPQIPLFSDAVPRHLILRRFLI